MMIFTRYHKNWFRKRELKLERSNYNYKFGFGFKLSLRQNSLFYLCLINFPIALQLMLSLSLDKICMRSFSDICGTYEKEHIFFLILTNNWRYTRWRRETIIWKVIELKHVWMSIEILKYDYLTQKAVCRNVAS